MTRKQVSGPFHTLYTQLTTGAISRRAFIERASALGIGAGVAMYAASVAAQTPTASPAASGGAGMASGTPRPEHNTENQQRGSGGELKIIQWQAPSSMSAHLATGDKDILAASLILEPLMHYGEDAGLLPNLITDVPSFENGMLAEDLSSVTLSLLPDVTWSDGEPFTSSDIRFTWEWVMDPANASTNTDAFGTIASIETPDDLTAIVTFNDSNPLWYAAFTGNAQGAVYPEHILAGGGEASEMFGLNPVGTGPYVMESFEVNDQVTYVVNENYREPNKPFFERVILKGGGEASSAARAVLETGEYHFAWYLQVDPDLLREMEAKGAGKLIVYPGVYAERLHLNFSDPNTEVDGQRSQKDTPHPFFSDPAVREAMRYAIQRDVLAEQLFLGGEDETAAKDVLSGIASLESPNTSWEYDPGKAQQILDDAGWVMDGEVRSKDGVQLEINFMTTTNQVRQQIQAVVKQNLEAIGIRTNINNIDGAIYFDSSAGNDQNTGHFYYDMNMHQTGAGAPTPITFMEGWYAGPDGANIAQASNDWSGANIQRYQNPEYDAVFEKVRTETDPQRLIELFIELNDILVEDGAVIPLVQVAEKSAAAMWLNEANFGFGPFGYNYWNIANWNRVEE